MIAAMLRNLRAAIWTSPRHLLVLLLTVYQNTLSPDHGPLKDLYPYGYCPHSPTCSMYAKQVITERGAIVGSLLAAKRLLSCHPWARPSNERLQTLAANMTTPTMSQPSQKSFGRR